MHSNTLSRNQAKLSLNRVPRWLDVSWLCRTCAIHNLTITLDVVHGLFDGRPIRVTAEGASSLENHTGGIVALMADAASMDHAANSNPIEVGFAVANR